MRKLRDFTAYAHIHPALSERANWFELTRFAVVGASGYVVNIAVYALAVSELTIPYALAAVLAFVVAATNNFLWNRYWTFKATHRHPALQAGRFLVVSLAALAVNLLILELLVAGFDFGKVPAQAIAVACATPLSFLANKLWSFR